jgi:antitoxin ParD1/3/4
MKNFVHERITAHGYSSVSEYVRHMIRVDEERKATERMGALLLEGLESGEPIAVTHEYWSEKKRELAERLAKNTTRR